MASTVECLQVWQDNCIFLQTNGEITVYSIPNGDKIYQSDPYMVLIYRNPAWIYRDVIFLSTLRLSRLVAKNAYWLVGWSVERRGRLERVLTQNRTATVEDVWCVALRRRLLACGTERGRILVYELRRQEDGHCLVDLDTEHQLAPALAIAVDKRPVVDVYLDFDDKGVVVYYMTSGRQLSCVVVGNCIGRCLA